MVDCPSCGKEMSVSMEEMDIPNFGSSIISSAVCENCGFKHSDVWHVEEKEGTRLTFKFGSEKDLSVRVIKSSKATVRIPELGIEVKPGMISDGFVSNVEGVLERMQDSLTGIKELMPKKGRKLDELMGKIGRMRGGKTKFTLIIEDPSGNSAIISRKTRKEKLEGRRQKR